jgi:hypothetical protein
MEFLNNNFFLSYKEGNLYGAAVLRVMQFAVTIVMEVLAVPYNESTQI